MQSRCLTEVRHREPKLDGRRARDDGRGLPRVEQRRADDQLRAGEVVELGRDRADALPERVAGGVPAHRAVALERVERAHPEELEVVERLEVGAVDHRGSLRLEAERDARAGEPGAVVGDEARRRPPAGRARAARWRLPPARRRVTAASTSTCGSPLIVSLRPSANAGPTAITTSAGSSPRSGGRGLLQDRRRLVLAAAERARVDDVRQRLQELPALALEPVAGARAEVGVRVVDRRADEAVRLDHRRGLEVVGRDALAEHPDHRLGDVLEAVPVEREGDVERRGAASEKLVRRLDVGRAVAIRHVGAAVRVRRGLDLLVGHVGQPELGEDGLRRARRPFAHADELVLGDGLDAAVDLPVALEREPLVEVVGVVVAAAEGVVAARHDGVAGGDEVGARAGTAP